MDLNFLKHKAIQVKLQCEQITALVVMSCKRDRCPPWGSVCHSFNPETYENTSEVTYQILSSFQTKDPYHLPASLKSPSKFLGYNCSNFLLPVREFSLMGAKMDRRTKHEKGHLSLSERYGRTQTPALSYTQGQRNLKHPTIKAIHKPQPDCLVMTQQHWPQNGFILLNKILTQTLRDDWAYDVWWGWASGCVKARMSVPSRGKNLLPTAVFFWRLYFKEAQWGSGKAVKASVMSTHLPIAKILSYIF